MFEAELGLVEEGDTPTGWIHNKLHLVVPPIIQGKQYKEASYSLFVRRSVCLDRVVCPNFGYPVLTSSFQFYALCRCRMLRKKLNHHSKAEKITTDSLFTIVVKLFFPCKNYDFNLTGRCLNLGQSVRTSGTRSTDYPLVVARERVLRAMDTKLRQNQNNLIFLLVWIRYFSIYDMDLDLTLYSVGPGR